MFRVFNIGNLGVRARNHVISRFYIFLFQPYPRPPLKDPTNGTPPKKKHDPLITLGKIGGYWEASFSDALGDLGTVGTVAAMFLSMLSFPMNLDPPPTLY